MARARVASIRLGVFSLVLGGAMAVYGIADRGYTSWLILGGIIAASGAATLLTGGRKRIRTDQFRLCARCGYNVTGNTNGKCPECGFTV